MASAEAMLLLRFPKSATASLAAAGRLRTVTGLDLEPLFETSAPAGPGLAAAGTEAAWYLARAADSAGRHPWDVAHEALSQAGAGLAEGLAPDIIEPDLVQQWDWEPPRTRSALAAAAACTFEDQDPAVPFRTGQFAWHLEDLFSQLKKAREQVAQSAADAVVRIGHLDTGYDPNHAALAGTRILHALERNFVDADRPHDATDRGVSGALRNPGHGTGTLGILAGSHFKIQQSGYAFDSVLGGAPDAEIVPIRVGNSVVQLTTSQVARGLNYAAELCQNEATRIHVLSMSMGGVASAAWADAVNRIYEAGIVFVAAAGNNFSAGSFGVPTRHVVYPARFRRVLAACGVMADRTPYFGLPFGMMQGNWGPEGAMATALAAFTPNTPWAQWGCSNLVLMSGAGTSSATPQIAAAAALYLQRHGAALLDRNRYPEPWMRVEAVRQALFQSADLTADGGRRDKLGNGILQAHRALQIAPIDFRALRKAEPDSAGFPFLNVLSGRSLAASRHDAMLQLEATQLVQKWKSTSVPNPLEAAIADPDRRGEDIPHKDIEAFLEAVAEHPSASQALRRRTRQTLVAMGRQVRTSATVPGQQVDAEKARVEPEHAAPLVPPRPISRRLRGYSVDPSLSTRLDTATIAEITFKVPWEKLDPGPKGEYLEVIDVDPASRKFYEPVNLDDPILLAQDGLPPSEGIPQFHQQMVYSVASLTIRNFETALGRKALWRPGPPPPGANRKDDSHFVRRLRIYPHALREANAYYSPNKVALLFGYFDSLNVNDGTMLPGGRVFTCLSHDIVAHETTHALLDGMHRRFLLPSNPDVLAFHEGFADCVAMLQHFTFPELVADQIRSTRGEIDLKMTMLTQLAIQFGFATGERTALRDAMGSVKDGHWLKDDPNPADYQKVMQPHARGRILVAAVFDAFLAIYRRRTSDLLRLATGGSGVLGPGAIHPDLVQRLADEASRAAQHVLTMCIRALDYCPPTDITFGEYLRAIITADCDLVEDDHFHYRVSFVEAFQRRGIFPPGVKTLSIGALRWTPIQQEDWSPSKWLQGTIGHLRRVSAKTLYSKSRGEIYFRERTLRMELHTALTKHLRNGGARGRQDAKFLGIDPDKSFEVHTARVAFRPRPDGGISPQLLLGLLQSTKLPIDPRDPGGPNMDFEGGCVIVGDLYTGRIRYCVRKGLGSAARQEKQRDFALREFASLRSTYFGQRALDQPDAPDTNEPFALVHRGDPSQAEN